MVHTSTLYAPRSFKNILDFFFPMPQRPEIVLFRRPNHHTRSASSPRRRQENSNLASKTATTPPILPWIHGVWVLTSWAAMGDRCREFAAFHHPHAPPSQPYLGKNYVRAFLLDEAWYGVGDNYGAFNGNSGVSSGDVICDVKSGQ